jgi:hypothetical protein
MAATSFAACAHVPTSLFSNTYAAPESDKGAPLASASSCRYAPTTTVETDTETELPKRSFAAPSLATIFAACPHSPPSARTPQRNVVARRRAQNAWVTISRI